MTDKGRLEDVKERLVIDVKLRIEDVNWLIKQAELAQDLDEKGQNLASKYIKTLEENKRYREALEFYATEDSYEETDQFTSNVNIDSGFRACKALELDENI